MEEKDKGMVLELGYGKDIKIDVKDKKILAALAKNSRTSPSNLSRIVGLSKDAIRYRIRRLKEVDLIRKNTIIMNPFIFSAPYTILLKLENINEEKEREIIEFLISHPFVIWSGQCSGEWDFVINIASKGIEHFDGLIREIKSKFFGHLKSYETLQILGLNRYETLPRSFYNEIKIDLKLLKKYFPFEDCMIDKKVELGESNKSIDKQDLKILKVLSEDCNYKIIEIAKKSGLSVDIVKYRIKKLVENNIILAFRTIVNGSYLHYHGYILFFQIMPNAEDKKRKMFEDFFNLHKDVAFFLKTTGRWDFEIYLFAKNPLKFNEIEREIRNKFYDIIESHLTLLILKDYKFDFLPKGLFVN